MVRRLVMILPLSDDPGGAAAPAGNHADLLDEQLIDARSKSEIRSLLAADRARAARGKGGSGGLLDRLQQTIGANDVRFALLDSRGASTDDDGRVVDRGDFTLTTGADDRACYRGSYQMTWVPRAADGWQLEISARAGSGRRRAPRPAVTGL